eukprot:scaffold145393_cov19-Tisochrysis_lutea.AAC.1
MLVGMGGFPDFGGLLLEPFQNVPGNYEHTVGSLSSSPLISSVRVSVRWALSGQGRGWCMAGQCGEYADGWRIEKGADRHPFLSG